MQYCKYISDKEVEHLKNVPHVWNPSPDTLKTYAEANGYKKYNSGTPDNWLCSEVTYRETAKNVYQEFQAPALDVCKARVSGIVESEASSVLASRRIIEYQGNKYVVDTQAEVNLAGLLIMGVAETAWTLADNSSIVLTLDQLQGLAQAFALSKNSVYEWHRAKLTEVNECQSVADLAAMTLSYSEGV